MIAALVNAPPPHPILIWIGLGAVVLLIWLWVEMGSDLSFTVKHSAEPEPETDEQVHATLHAYVPKSFDDKAAKGFSRTPGAICCVFCASALTWDGTEEVWDCQCVGARRSRVRVS